MSFRSQCSGGNIQPPVAALFFHHFVEHVCSGAPGNIFINKNDPVGFFERSKDDMMNIKRKELQGKYFRKLLILKGAIFVVLDWQSPKCFF